MIEIYKIISPSGRIYIGQTLNIERRRKSYYSDNCSKCQPKLFNSIKKYGFKNHLFEIIEECNQELLNERERHWQEYYDVIKTGLNCILTDTDRKPRVFSEQYKAKIKASWTKERRETCHSLRYQLTTEERKNIYNNIPDDIKTERARKISAIHKGREGKITRLDIYERKEEIRIKIRR